MADLILRSTLVFAFLVPATLSGAVAGRIACTEEAFTRALADACPSGNTTITFDCRDTTILISQASDRYDRLVSCDDVTIDGEDRNITFRLDPPCHSELACPDDNGGAWLVSLRGNRGLVRNLTVDSFFEGIHAGYNVGNTVERVTFIRPCDDAFTNIEGATGSVFRDNVIRNACDKALQLYGRDIAATQHLDPSSGDYWDVRVLDNTFIDCKQPIRTTRRGRIQVRGNTFQEENPGTLFGCDGPRFEGSGVAVYFEGNLVDGCRRGLRVNEDVDLIATGNTFRGNVLRGALVRGSSRALFEANRFEANGGGGSSEAFYGGLAVAESASVDAGGGSTLLDGVRRSSAGANVFILNEGPSDPELDLHNVGGSLVKAEGNYWGGTEPVGRVTGDVDYTPWLTEEPGGPGGEPPPAPVNLRRTDTLP
jgi:hypothetical protein